MEGQPDRISSLMSVDEVDGSVMNSLDDTWSSRVVCFRVLVYYAERTVRILSVIF